MLWPIVLPFKITFWILAGVVAVVTLTAPALKWKRRKTIWISLVLAGVAFIPSCSGIMAILDAQRFGVFHYDSYSEVQDPRIERFLPPQARDIALDKFAMGHRARYSISAADLQVYLDKLWRKHGSQSTFVRNDKGEGLSVSAEDFAWNFGKLNWPPLENAVKYHSPYAHNGAGATYFFEAQSGTVYHRAAYW